MKTETTIYAKNKRAFYDYFVNDTFEAGISLKGNEVVAIKENGCSINGAWVCIKNGEAFIQGMNIPKFDKSNFFAEEPLRTRKLLLHKNEIEKLGKAISAEGSTVVPLQVYTKAGFIKLEIAICTGKKNYDKRNTIAKRDAKRKIEASLKRNII